MIRIDRKTALVMTLTTLQKLADDPDIGSEPDDHSVGSEPYDHSVGSEPYDHSVGVAFLWRVAKGRIEGLHVVLAVEAYLVAAHPLGQQGNGAHDPAWTG